MVEGALVAAGDAGASVTGEASVIGEGLVIGEGSVIEEASVTGEGSIIVEALEGGFQVVIGGSEGTVEDTGVDRETGEIGGRRWPSLV